MGYFHWTDEETYKEITHKGNLFERVMSYIFGIEPKDLVPGSGNAYYGEGVYFTDYGPDYARSTIAGKCFGHSQSQDKVQCYFEIEFHGNTSIEKVEDHVWLLSPKSTAQQNVVDHGYHPDFDPDDDDDYDDDDYDDYDDDDDDDDDDDSGGECPVCGEEGDLTTQDDEYDGQEIYTCYECSIYFDEDSDFWPSDWDGSCRICQDNTAASDCPKEQCGECCNGNYCDRHG